MQVISNNTGSNSNDSKNSGSILIIDKNYVHFASVNLPPLNIALFKQEYLDWEPAGGLCLSSILILFNKHTINFYERAQNLKKTWTIEVMQ